MEIPRHPRAFCQALIEAGADGSRNLQHTQSVDNPHDEDTRNKAENSEPVRLVPGRRNAEDQGGTGVVPDVIVIACNHFETVLPGSQIVIKSLPASACILPIDIAPFELIAKSHLLGNHETESSVVDFEVSSESGKAYMRLRFIGLTISNQFFDVHRRGDAIAQGTILTNHFFPCAVLEPKLAIGRQPGHRRGPGLSGWTYPLPSLQSS